MFSTIYRSTLSTNCGRKMGSTNVSIKNMSLTSRNILGTSNIPRVSNILRSSIRHLSTAPVKKSYKELFNTSVLKSMFLMVCFGTVVVDVVKNRRELEMLEHGYQSKFNILEEVIEKLRNGDHVDLARELKLANSLTSHNQDISDIEFDEQLEKFFKMADQVEEVKEDVIEEFGSSSADPTIKIESNKFL